MPAQELAADVSSRRGLRRALAIISPTPVRIIAGKTASIQVGVPQDTPLGTITFELNEPPDGLSIQGLSEVGRGTEIVLKSDAARLKAPLAGNLIVNVLLTPKNPAPRNAAQGVPATQSTTQVGTAHGHRPRKTTSQSAAAGFGWHFPAIPFEVVADSSRTAASDAK